MLARRLLMAAGSKTSHGILASAPDGLYLLDTNTLDTIDFISVPDSTEGNNACGTAVFWLKDYETAIWTIAFLDEYDDIADEGWGAYKVHLTASGIETSDYVNYVSNNSGFIYATVDPKERIIIGQDGDQGNNHYSFIRINPFEVIEHGDHNFGGDLRVRGIQFTHFEDRIHVGDDDPFGAGDRYYWEIYEDEEDGWDQHRIDRNQEVSGHSRVRRIYYNEGSGRSVLYGTADQLERMTNTSLLSERDDFLDLSTDAVCELVDENGVEIPFMLVGEDSTLYLYEVDGTNAIHHDSLSMPDDFGNISSPSPPFSNEGAACSPDGSKAVMMVGNYLVLVGIDQSNWSLSLLEQRSWDRQNRISWDGLSWRSKSDIEVVTP